MVAAQLGMYKRATALLEQVLPAHRAHGVGWALGYQADIRQQQGDSVGAAALYDESLAVFEDLGDMFGIGSLLANRADVAREMGDYGQAQRLFRESLQIRRTLRDKSGFAKCFEALAGVTMAGRQPERAARLLGAAFCLLGHWTAGGAAGSRGS